MHTIIHDSVVSYAGNVEHGKELTSRMHIDLSLASPGTARVPDMLYDGGVERSM